MHNLPRFAVSNAQFVGAFCPKNHFLLGNGMNIGVLGGSGKVGRQVVRQLLSYPSETVAQVVLLNRRALEKELFPDGDPRLVQHIVDMSSGELLRAECTSLLQGVDVVVSTMGIGSGKGSAELFRHVEVALPSAFAQAAHEAGARRAVLLTSVGADIQSTSSWLAGGAAEGKFFYYKGLVEKNFAETGFAKGVTVFRPAGLLGTGHTPAWLDRVLPRLDWLAPARFRSIHVHQLAQIMARTAVKIPDTAGSESQHIRILEGKDLHAHLEGNRGERIPKKE